MMYEVERKELERCAKIGSMPREVTIIIKRNDKLDKNRYNEAFCNEVAMIFVGKDGCILCAVVEARNTLGHLVTRKVRGAQVIRDTAVINMAAASLSSKRGCFAFFFVCLVRTPRRALSIMILASARDFNPATRYTRLAASYIDARHSCY